MMHYNIKNSSDWDILPSFYFAFFRVRSSLAYRRSECMWVMGSCSTADDSCRALFINVLLAIKNAFEANSTSHSKLGEKRQEGHVFNNPNRSGAHRTNQFNYHSVAESPSPQSNVHKHIAVAVPLNTNNRKKKQKFIQSVCNRNL